MDTEKIEKLYADYTGRFPEHIEVLPGAGSNRRYFRMRGTQNVIGVYGNSTEENRAFIYMSNHFRRKGLPVPQVYAASDDGMYYIEEDLGDTSLFSLIGKGRQGNDFSNEVNDLLKQTIRLLPRLQFEGIKGFDTQYCYPQAEFNRRTIFWDLNYFKYCFLKLSDAEFQENLLEDDFEHLSEQLLSCNTPAFMYRDFQSRNVMIKENCPYFIDFQGGRIGPFFYDVASFLWQAKANFSDSTRETLLNEYINALQPYQVIDRTTFYEQLKHFVLFRTLQVLGAYGFRGYFERKEHFIESIPYALNNLRHLLTDNFEEYPYLSQVLRKLVMREDTASHADNSLLTVRVISFSYRKGIPDDPSGNGGGYVFDCRATHNPGKYEQYKSLTGLDVPVKRFLETDGEILSFLNHTDALTAKHVQRYMERGFSHLQICFGCTGGQHRSVYAAQHTAEYINKRFGVRVELIHREQSIEQSFPSHPL